MTGIFCLLCFGASRSESFGGTRSDALKSMNLQEKQMDAFVAGKKCRIPVVVQSKYGDMYLSLTDKNTRPVFTALGVKITCDAGSGKLSVCSGFVSDALPVVVENSRMTCGKEESRLSPPPFFVRGEPFVHIKHLPALTGGHISHNKKNNALYFEPSLCGVTSVKGKKNTVLTVACTGPFEAEYFILKNPMRYVVDLKHVHLTSRQTALPKREISDPHIGKITYSQNSVYPNKVRVVVPISENVEVQPFRRDFPDKFQLSFTEKKPAPVSFHFPGQKVTVVKPTPGKDRLDLNIAVSGPAHYEWHRFTHPDNRVIVDIHNASLAGQKRTVDPKSPLVSTIRVAQFQLKPKPIVRIVVDMKKSYDFKISTKKGTNEIVCAVTSKIVKPANDALDGNGATSYPQKKKVICIDPGHGGTDPGAVNSIYGYREADVVLEISKYLSEMLSRRGWNVVMTRTTNRDVSYYGSSDMEELAARVKVARDMKADIFVSVHCNASSNRSVRGISTHWWKTSDKYLAQCLQARLMANLSSADRKIQQDNFYVVSRSAMPAVLIEAGFISNESDCRFLGNSAGRKKVATAIMEGIEQYFKNTK